MIVNEKVYEKIIRIADYMRVFKSRPHLVTVLSRSLQLDRNSILRYSKILADIGLLTCTMAGNNRNSGTLLTQTHVLLDMDSRDEIEKYVKDKLNL